MLFHIALISLYLLASVFIASVAADCTNPTIRKEWSSLTETEKQAYLSAVNKLKDRTKATNADADSPSTLSFDNFSQFHYDAVYFAHSVSTKNPIFLPWHRVFLLRYEQALQSIDSSIVLPYWDWSLYSQSPSSAEVFSSNYFGGTGDSSTKCVKSGKFSGWQVTVGHSQCLKRSFNSKTTWYGPDSVASILNTNDFISMSYAIENGPHGSVHNGIGGDVGDMATIAFAANDPLFWIHHANIDRLWWYWQTYCPSWANNYNGTTSKTLSPFDATVANTFSTTSGMFCYRYADSSKSDRALSACPSPNANAVKDSTTTTTTTTAAATTTSASTISGATATATNHNYWLELQLAGMVPGASGRVHYQRRDSPDAGYDTGVNTTAVAASSTNATKTSTEIVAKSSSLSPLSSTASAHNATTFTQFINVTTTRSSGFATVSSQPTGNVTTSINGTTSVNVTTSTANYTVPDVYSVNATFPGVNVTVPIPYEVGTGNLAIDRVATSLKNITCIPLRYVKAEDSDDEVDSQYVGYLPTYVKPSNAVNSSTLAGNNSVVVLDANDSSDKYHLRHPTKLPTAWIRTNGYDLYAVRELEVKLYYLIDQINSLDEYVPPDALINLK